MPVVAWPTGSETLTEPSHSDETEVEAAQFGTVVLPNRPADNEAGGSGAAAVAEVAAWWAQCCSTQSNRYAIHTRIPNATVALQHDEFTEKSYNFTIFPICSHDILQIWFQTWVLPWIHEYTWIQGHQKLSCKHLSSRKNSRLDHDSRKNS